MIISGRSVAVVVLIKALGCMVAAASRRQWEVLGSSNACCVGSVALQRAYVSKLEKLATLPSSWLKTL